MRNIFSTLIWALAFFIFAYPVLIEAYFNATKDFVQEYYANQGNLGAAFANGGYLFLASYDYIIGLKKIQMNAWMITLNVIGFVCLLAIAGIAYFHISDTIQVYPILSRENLCFHVHIIFLLIIVIIKYLTLRSITFVDSDNVVGVSR